MSGSMEYIFAIRLPFGRLIACMESFTHNSFIHNIMASCLLMLVLRVCT